MARLLTPIEPTPQGFQGIKINQIGGGRPLFPLGGSDKKTVDTPKTKPLGLGETKLGQIISGIGKSGFETAKMTAELGEKAIQAPLKAVGLIPKEEKTGTEKLQTMIEKNRNIEPGQLLEGTTPLEKGAKIGADVAQLAEGAYGLVEGIGKMASIGKIGKELQLTADELKAVNGKKLETLSKDALSEGKTVGGILKKKAYDVADKVKPLYDEFKHVLTGEKPEENVQNIRNYQKQLYQESLDLFKGNEKAVNKTTVTKTLKDAIKNDPDAIYGKDTKEVSDKAVNKFLSYVKKGTNKGLEQARNKWYSSVKKVSDDKLSSANKTLHTAIKQVIKDSLPEESQKAYDAAKTTIAKANDVKEILKAKVKASIGKSTIQKIAPYAKGAAGLAGLDWLYGKAKGLFGK